MAKVRVDFDSVKSLGNDVRAGMIISLGRLGERGYQLLRKEVPKKTTNLQQGIVQEKVDETNLSVTLTVSARSARTSGGNATVHYPSGKTKEVRLKPQIEFNYAEVVARGRASIRPKTGKALLIEVDSAPSGESYITANGKIFVVRTSAKAQKPNPFDERAAEQLQKEAPIIVNAVFRELFN
jgi:hypothetical protein